jgi:hypothetical protein
MGCCTSAPADVEETTHLMSPTKKEQVTTNIIPKMKNTNFENISPSLPRKTEIAQSYQKDLKESEILQNIIEQTQQNFINIAQSPGGMQLTLNTKLKVNQTLLNKEINNSELFGLPEFKSVENIRQIAQDGGISDKNMKLMKQLSENLLKSSKFQINDEEIGPLIMKLPEIDME